jgi:pimeloyl-ACP methyl ester carboxylesterase
MLKSMKMLAFACVFVVFLVLLSLWGFYVSIKPPKILSTITPKDLGMPYENAAFATADGVLIAAWFIPSTEGSQAKTLVLLHGYPADKGNILPPLAFLHKKYNLLLFDFRYLGQSGGNYSTIGAKETEDLKAAIEFLKKRGINEIGVWGFSMGGAVALRAVSDAPEIKAIVSESSYAELGLLASELYRIPLLQYPLGYLTTLWAKLFLGMDVKSVSPLKSAPELKIPVLLIHSRHDEVIPFRHAILLKEALKDNPKAEFWFEEILTHGEFGSEYQKRIENFFDRNL